MSTAPTPPPSPTTCPSCKAALVPGQDQCPQCGVFVSKWKDPKARAAEARLAQIAKETAGPPTGLIVFVLLLIGVPAALIFIPDVGVPVLGAKMRYQFKKGSTHSYKSRSSLDVSSNGIPVDQWDMELDVTDQIVESDSGGNMFFRRATTGFSAGPAGGVPANASPERLQEWGLEINMGGRGKIMQSLAAANRQMQVNSNIMKMHTQLRSEQADFGKSSGLDSVAPTTSFIDQIMPDRDWMCRPTWLEWPADRIKKGTVLTKECRYQCLGRSLTVSWQHAALPVKVAGYGRTTDGYTIRLEWDAPVTATVSSTDPFLNSRLKGATISAAIKGTAEVAYPEGEFRRVEEKLSGEIRPLQEPPMPVNVALLFEKQR